MRKRASFAGFFVAGVVFGWGLTAYRPTARAAFVDSVDEGVAVLVFQNGETIVAEVRPDAVEGMTLIPWRAD